MSEAGGPVFSPDGWWWWSGFQWMPVVSRDGRWRWTGTSWAPVQRASTPRWVIRDGAIWLVLFLAWIPVVTILLERHAPTPATAWVGGALGAASLMATLIYGGLLGRHGRWRDIGVAALVGTASLIFCYVALMITQPDPNNTNDIGAGAGLVILGPPTFVFVATCLALGGGIGGLTRRRRVGAS